ncbi:MAG: uroporphyrinogen decarboxylase family protein [Thermoguttaceae bacterium]|jgi:uroporphyrinogen decarboxylase
MEKIERVEAVLSGLRPDRPPLGFWYHFSPDCVAGPPAVAAHLAHLETYDLDFLKVMNDNRYPVPGPISAARDLEKLPVLEGDEGGFARQLELIGELARRLAGRAWMTTTIFNTWSTLRRLVAPQSDAHGPPTLGPSSDPRDALLSRLLREAPAAVAHALGTIAESLARFARHCIQKGAQGIYLSVRDDWVDTPGNGPGTYDRLVRPGDLAILAGAEAGSFNFLHACGRALDFRRFAGYPAHVLHWADRAAGPSIAEAAGWVRPALCGGLDNLGTMPHGSPEDCAAELADAVRQAGQRPLLVAPGCTFDPHAVPAANLHAIRRAVERCP